MPKCSSAAAIAFSRDIVCGFMSFMAVATSSRRVFKLHFSISTANAMERPATHPSAFNEHQNASKHNESVMGKPTLNQSPWFLSIYALFLDKRFREIARSLTLSNG
jgi:hypothetical protein